MNSHLFVLFLAFALTVNIASSSDTISDEVMAGLDKLYKEPIKDDKLKNFPLTKLITVLSSNDGYRRSLENVIKFGEKRFIAQVHFIVDEDLKKLAWKSEDYVYAAVSTVNVVSGVTNTISFCKDNSFCNKLSSNIGNYASTKIQDLIKLTSKLWGSSK